jgi:hypothetical protein
MTSGSAYSISVDIRQTKATKDPSIMMTSSSSPNFLALGYYSLDVLPRAIIQDLIFREMLCLEDIACLEVAAKSIVGMTKRR